MGRDTSPVESQFSLHTLMSFPVPTAQPNLLLITSRTARIPLQQCDMAPEEEHERRSFYRQYFPNRIWPSSESGCLSKRQANFARRASLKSSISRKPSPPAFFSIVSFSHDTQQSRLISGFRSHQNRVKTDCICLQRDCGSLKQDIAYDGIAL